MEHLLNNATEILLLLFLVITFIQSGLDKIVDWNGNLSWLKGHFAESPLKNMVPLLLGIILIIEMVCRCAVCDWYLSNYCFWRKHLGILWGNLGLYCFIDVAFWSANGKGL